MKQIYLLRFLAAKIRLFLLIHNTPPPFSSKYLIIIDLNQIPLYIYYSKHATYSPIIFIKNKWLYFSKNEWAYL